MHSYRIVAADVTDFDLVAKPRQFKHGHVLGYEIEQNQKVDAERKLLIYTTSVVITNKETEEQLLVFKTICFFEMKVFDQYIITLQDKTIKILPTIGESMSRAAVGTTRGLMCAQLKNTYISNAILPILPFEF